jgi:hypothetical protein
MLVEPSCGSALSLIYFCDRLNLEFVSNDGPVVVVVCGGNMTTVDLFDTWRREFNLL